MKIRELFTEDDALTPVVGIALLVAITVILGATVATFVLGFGDQSDPAPTADFSFNYDSGSPNTLDISLSDGEQIDGGQVFVRGQGISSSTNVPGDWNTIGSTSGDIDAGDSLTLDNVNSDYVVNIVWEDPDTDATSTLDSDEGPDA